MPSLQAVRGFSGMQLLNLTFLARMVGGLGLAAAVAGCSALPGLPFAATSAAPATSKNIGLSSAAFAKGDIQLVAPKGYCIDKNWLRRTDGDGFAMMARCDLLGAPGFFGHRDLAVITATLGPLTPDTTAPTLAELTSLAKGATVLDSRDDLLLPLVKLDRAGHGVQGASPEHWRGGFALNGHLLAVAVYAPDGNAMVSERGALLLNELTRRTIEASAQPKQVQSPNPSQPAGAPLRPRLRPGEDPIAGTKKLSLRQRIAGLFNE